MAIKQLPSDGWPGGKRPSSGAPLPESLEPGGVADSAGFSWEGRTFDHHGNDFADDNGETPEEFLAATIRISEVVKELTGATDASSQALALQQLAEAHTECLSVLSQSRVLIPLIAEAGDYGLTPEGKVVEKSQELSIVQVAAPDGRKVMPVFTSSASMLAWNPLARPIPVPAVQAAVAAASEETDLIVVDPGHPQTEFVVRRTQLEPLALKQEHIPAWADPEILTRFQQLKENIADKRVQDIFLAPGDPEARLRGTEVTIGVQLIPGLNREELGEIGARLSAELAADDFITRSVDSLSIKYI